MDVDAVTQLYSSPLWTRCFMLAANAMFAGCLYNAIKVGILEWHARRDRPPLQRLVGAGSQVLYLGAFVLLYWLLESAAHTFTPYYVYSPDFADGVAFHVFAQFPVPDVPVSCPDRVRWLVQQDPAFGRIPFSVLLMEASLTYTGMWTALLLGVGYRLVPLWAGLFVVVVDVLIDPVVAGKYDCSGIALPATGPGLGFWHWYLPTGPDGYLGDWFGVPLFNYAAWFAGPVVLISLAMIVEYLRGRVLRRMRGIPVSESSPVGLDAVVVSLLLVIGAAVYLLTFLAPSDVTRRIPIPGQWAVLGLVIVVTAGLVAARIRSYETRRVPDASLTLPPGIFLLIAMLALLLEGLFLEVGGLIAVALVVFVSCLFFTLWPYEALLLRTLRRVIDLDRLIRVAYFGFPSTLVLLGGFAVGIERTATEFESSVGRWHVGGLLTAALAFHVFAYVLNDFVDLPVDRTQSKRRRDPLVRGAVRPETAFALALVQVPVLVLVSLLLEAPAGAYGFLFTGLALMGVYDVWGKRIPWPLVTDLVQALGWACLVPYGALVVDPARQSDNWVLVYAVAIFGVGFILLISGIHGGLRDLANDVAHGRMTTARLLGARVDAASGVVLCSRRIRVFAHAIHAAMFLLPALIALDAAPLWLGSRLELTAAEHTYLGTLLATVFVCSHLVLVRVVREQEPRRDTWISVWGLVVMQAPLLGFAPFLGGTLESVLLVPFYAPLLATRQYLGVLMKWTHPAIAARIEDPPG